MPLASLRKCGRIEAQFVLSQLLRRNDLGDKAAAAIDCALKWIGTSQIDSKPTLFWYSFFSAKIFGSRLSRSLSISARFG